MTTTHSHRRLHSFICVEGIDGVGKSTVARKLATALGGIYYKTPPAPFDSIRAEIDRRSDAAARLYFYVSAVFFASLEIGELRARQPVVCDRYIFSTLAYHIAMDESFRNFVIPPTLMMPDETFLLVADEAERLRRLLERGEAASRHDSALEANRVFLAQVQREFRRFDLHVIDTTQSDADETAQQILTRVNASPNSELYLRWK